MGVFFFFSLTCRASGGRHAAKEHSEPCPSPAPAKRTGRRRHSEEKKIPPKKGSQPACLAAAAESAFEATEPGPPQKKEGLTAKAQGAR